MFTVAELTKPGFRGLVFSSNPAVSREYFRRFLYEYGFFADKVDFTNREVLLKSGASVRFMVDEQKTRGLEVSHVIIDDPLCTISEETIQFVKSRERRRLK